MSEYETAALLQFQTISTEISILNGLVSGLVHICAGILCTAVLVGVALLVRRAM